MSRFVFMLGIFCTTLMGAEIFSFLGITTAGSWLRQVVVNSSQDMNFKEDLQDPTNSGSSPTRLAIVFSADDELSKTLKGMSSSDFFKQKDELMKKYPDTYYYTMIDVVPSNTQTIDMSPRPDQKKVYDKTTFVVAYWEYDIEGNHMSVIPVDKVSVMFTFNRKEVVISYPTSAEIKK